jgi:hypothetical protein
MDGGSEKGGCGGVWWSSHGGRTSMGAWVSPYWVKKMKKMKKMEEIEVWA